MARVFVTATQASLLIPSAGSINARDLLRSLIAAAKPSLHALADAPEQADLIIFAESHKDPAPGQPDASSCVLAHPVYRAHTQRCVIHNGQDLPIPVVPGLYPSIPSHWASRLRCLGAPYLVEPNPHLPEDPLPPSEPRLLASFMGSCVNKPLRKALVSAASAPGRWDGIECIDSGVDFVNSLRTKNLEAHNALKAQFVDHMINARFCLCPSGAGASSYRVYEAMQCARAPVIIANNWARPSGPDWASFAIFITPGQLPRLPEILREHQDQWQELGDKARDAWATHYAPHKIGNEIVRLAQLVLDSDPHHRISRRLTASWYRQGPARWARLQARLNRRFARG